MCFLRMFYRTNVPHETDKYCQSKWVFSYKALWELMIRIVNSKVTIFVSLKIVKVP